LKPRGRSVLALAAVLYLLATVVWLGIERRSPRQFLAPGSALNEGERGASLARAYLRARRRSLPGRPGSGLLTRPVVAAELPADAVVFRLEPVGVPWQPRRAAAPAAKGKSKKGKKGKKSTDGGTDGGTDEDTDEKKPRLDRFVPLLTAEEEEWVRGGGRLVLGIAGGYGPVWTEKEPSLARLDKAYPLWPGVEALRPPVRRSLRGPALGRAQAVVLAGENPVVARLILGAGEVVLLACPEVLENGRLAVADHLALLEALAGPRRPVLFDEATHGLASSTGLLALLVRWGLGPALLLAGLAALAGVFRQGVRVGPAERDDPDIRSEAVDLVDSLGELYDRALSRGQAIRLYWEGFVHAVGVDSGLSGPAAVARARELAAGFAPPAAGEDLSREGFERALATLNVANRAARKSARKLSRRRDQDGQHDAA